MTSNRLHSVDALRGLTVATMLVVNDAGDWNHVYPWLEHADWNGCTPADFIFPTFLLIVGISITLALSPQLEDPGNKTGRGRLRRSVLMRGLRLFLLGVALHWIASLLIPGRAFRLFGVLQRIAICFSVSGLLAIHCRSVRLQWTLFGGIALGYWALLAAGGSLKPDFNLADRVDTLLLGHWAYEFNPASGLAHDPEGILSTLPSLATVILGMRVGDLLRAGSMRRLLGLGLAAIAAGGLWSLLLPFNKQLWTPSFLLWTGGFGILAVAAAHHLIDVRAWPAVGRSLGVNAMAAYAGSWLATCVLVGSGVIGPIYANVFEKPLVPLAGPDASSLAFALAFTAAFWLMMRYFFKRGWRITI